MNTICPTIISEIRSDIRAIERDRPIYKETNFAGRADAIDFIDFHIIDRIEGSMQAAELKKDRDILKQRAEKVKRALEEIDTKLFKKLRDKIREDSSVFRTTIHKYYVPDGAQPAKIGYDNLDVFISGLLSGQVIPEATKEREPEMVFYQKTPARIIFEMIELAQPGLDDVFFDLGSGIGQVAVLVNLMSGAVAKGIEYEPAYCNYAKACALQLNLSNVEFTNADARKGDYSQATIFFMYTPFEGLLLQEVLEILQRGSRKRTIRIFTYGPCSHQVARQNWLNCINGTADNPYKLYEFRSFAHPSMI